MTMKPKVAVLLLGQSESGKSTILKQFQLLRSPSAFHAERQAWRTVIYLNLISSIRRILDVLAPEPNTLDDHDDSGFSEPTSLIISASGRPSSAILGTRVSNYDTYRQKFEPLTELEERLMLLSSPDEEEAMHLGSTQRRPVPPTIEGWWEDPNDPVHVLNACAPAMQDMWHDKQVRELLQEKHLRLEESGGFYLDEIPRITANEYIPSNADILKARLKTMGVVEYTYSISSSSYRSVNWRIYDVGGALNQREAWIPYFEDVNGIIFLAPISAFDQVLAEDNRINRLEDSLSLWKSIISNKLLARINFVLFLNKCDLLLAKLEAGIKLNEYIISYGDRPNDYESVSKYFRNKFGVIHQTFTSNEERELYIHFTTAIDAWRMPTTISIVRDLIIKTTLRNMKLF